MTAEASASSAEPDWDSISVEGEAPEAGASHDGAIPVDQPSSLMSRDDFYAMFEMAFHLPNAALKRLPPFPLDALAIKPDERDQARAASDAIYDIALETGALRWLLMPDALWLQRAIPIGIFFGSKAMAVAAEIRAKRAQEINPRTEPKAEPKTEPKTEPEAAAGAYASPPPQTPQHADLASGAAGAI